MDISLRRGFQTVDLDTGHAQVIARRSIENAINKDATDAVAVAAETRPRGKWGGTFRVVKRKDDSAELAAAKSVVILRVSCGPSYTVAISSQGHVYLWGSAPFVPCTIPTPVLVGDLTGCAFVSAGGTLLAGIASPQQQLQQASASHSHALANELKMSMGSDDRFMSLIDSPKFQKSSNSGSGSGSRKKKIDMCADPNTRVKLWNDWIEAYVNDRDRFVADWSHLEEVVRGLLRVAVREDERAVLETLLVFVLVPSVNVKSLIDLLHAVAQTSPSKRVVRNVVSLFSALAAGSQSQEQDIALPADLAAASMTDLCAATERGVMQLSAAAVRNRARLDALSKAPSVCDELIESYTNVAPRSREEVASYEARRQAELSERDRLVEEARVDIEESQARLNEVLTREAELRRLLALTVAERIQVEDELKLKRSSCEAKMQECTRELDALDVSTRAALSSAEAAVKVVDVVEDVAQMSFSSLADETTAPLRRWQSKLLKALAQLQTRVYAQYVSYQDGTLETNKDDVLRLNQTADRCDALLEQLQSNVAFPKDMSAFLVVKKDIAGIRVAVNAIL